MKFWAATAFMQSHELVDVAKALDEAGYHGAAISDHIFYPKVLESPYPYTPDGHPIWAPETPWPDSWVLIGAMLAVTENLRFTNNVYIAPNRPLIATAKSVGTAAAMSGGRVELGVGAGWMREEFELLGEDFDNRGPRLDEMIQALRELWKPGWVEWHGEYYDIPPMTLSPAPPGPVEIHCGGHSNPALRRAACYCDGWIGVGYTFEQAEMYIGKLRGYLADYGRENDEFEINVTFTDEGTLDLFKRAEEELGVTGTLCMPWLGMGKLMAEEDREELSRPAAAYVDSINRFAEEIVQPLQG